MATSNSIKSIVYLNGDLYLCGWERTERLNLLDNSIESYPFRCGTMHVAKNGQLWVETGSQVKVYDGRSWQATDFPHAGGIDYFSETSDGLIWASSSSLSYFDPKTAQTSVIVPSIPIPPSTPAPVTGEWAVTLPSKGRLGPVFEAADGAIWYNQQFDGIVRWDRTTNQKQLWGPNDGFQGFVPIPAKFIQTRDGTIWVGTDTGVYRLYNDAWQTWIFPGEKQGKFRRDEDDFRILDLIEDQGGNVWAVFNRAGVAMWNGSNWQPIGDFEFPAGPQSIFQDKSDAVWIGSLQRGVTKYEQGKLKEYPGIHLTTFLETLDHRLFGGGSDGLFLYNPQSDQWNPYPPG